jgi:hypothetical protein
MAALIASPDSSLRLLHSPPHQPQTPHTLLAPSKQPCDCHRPLVPLPDRETTPGTSRTTYIRANRRECLYTSPHSTQSALALPSYSKHPILPIAPLHQD